MPPARKILSLGNQHAYRRGLGISAKIWIITDAEIAACRSRPEHINTLFHEADDYAKIWGARPLCATIERLMGAGIGLQKLDDTDPTFALDHAALRALVARGDADHVLDALVNPEIPAIGGDRGGDIADVMARALKANAGIVFCIFEDW